MGQIQTTACFCMVCALRIAFTFLNFLFIFYIKRGIYFEVLAHTIMETWQVQNLDELGEQAGDSGKGCSLNSKAVCFLRGLFFFFRFCLKIAVTITDVPQKQSVGRIPSCLETGVSNSGTAPFIQGKVRGTGMELPRPL